MAEQCFTCSAMAHGISVAKLHRQSLRLLTLAQAVRKRRVQRAAAAAVFSQNERGGLQQPSTMWIRPALIARRKRAFKKKP